MVRTILQKHVPQYEVWAFGSRAKWTVKDYSDLDLCVVSDKPLSVSILGAMAEDFSDSDLPWKVDVVDWATTSESFRKIIEMDKVVVQKAGQTLSGVNEWPEVKLRDVFEINPRREIKPGTVTPFVPMDALPEHSREISRIDRREYTGSGTRFKNGDTLFARITPCLENGKTAYVSGLENNVVAHGSTEYIVIAEKKNVSNSLFAYYLARSPEFRAFAIGHMEGTSGRQRVPTDAVATFQFRLPPLSEQKAIAHILGTLDDKIELNRRMNATLEATARALFQSWFVDFDPVRAKLDGRQPIGLDAATAALFPAHFQESSLGHIPQGWEVKSLSEITMVITKGTTPSQDDMASVPDTDIRVNYVRVNAIQEDGTIISDKLTKIPLSVHARALKRSILRANDVLYTIAGTIGRIATAEDWLLPANTNQAVAIIRPKLTIPAGFLSLTMRHEVFREELHNNIVQAVQANLSLGMLSKARAVVPPEDVLFKIFKPINNIVSQISANRAQSRTLTTLRNMLLQRLLSKELRVADNLSTSH